MEPQRRKTFSYSVTQPGIGLLVLPASYLWRSFSTRESNVRGSTHPEQLLYETPLLYLGLRSHWHQHCHLGCNSGLPKQRESWDSSPTRLFWMNRWEPQDCFLGLTCLSTYVLPGCKVLKFSVQFVRTFALCHSMLYLGSLFVFECPVFIESYPLRWWNLWGKFKITNFYFKKILADIRGHKPPCTSVNDYMVMIIVSWKVMLFFLRHTHKKKLKDQKLC